jgi:hypothetical protein
MTCILLSHVPSLISTKFGTMQTTNWVGNFIEMSYIKHMEQIIITNERRSITKVVFPRDRRQLQAMEQLHKAKSDMPVCLSNVFSLFGASLVFCKQATNGRFAIHCTCKNMKLFQNSYYVSVLLLTLVIFTCVCRVL